LFHSTRFRVHTRSGLRFLAAHGWDRRSRPKERHRADWAGNVRTILGSFWKAGPLVVVGDLNANPWDFEVTRRNGWFASRRNDIWSKGAYTIPNTTIKAKPLVNLTWRMVTEYRGTYFYRDDDDLNWHFLDQFLASKDLLAEGQLVPRVLTDIGGTSLCDENGKPRTTVEPSMKDDSEDSDDDDDSKALFEYSDHLPIELRIPVDTLIKLCNSPRQGCRS
jgi:hypothetical protein